MKEGEAYAQERAYQGHNTRRADAHRQPRPLFCDSSSCENCGGCSMGVGSIEQMYKPYIDGKLELSEINMLHAAKSYVIGG